MAHARAGHTATLLPDGKVLVTGGGSTDGPMASAELYDFKHQRWTSAGDMSVARSGRIAVLLGDGRVLVAGGAKSPPNPVLASAEVCGRRCMSASHGHRTHQH
jgi:Galactose oxidase, central domain